MNDAMLQAAANMTDPAVQATSVRAGASPVLNIPYAAAAVIKATATSAAKLDKPSPAAVAAVPRSTGAAPSRSTTSGAAKRAAHNAKQMKRGLWLEETLRKRRARLQTRFSA